MWSLQLSWVWFLGKMIRAHQILYTIIGSILEIREIVICCFTHRQQVTVLVNYNNYPDCKQCSQILDLYLSLLHCFYVAASGFNYLCYHFVLLGSCVYGLTITFSFNCYRPAPMNTFNGHQIGNWKSKVEHRTVFFRHKIGMGLTNKRDRNSWQESHFIYPLSKLHRCSTQWCCSDGFWLVRAGYTGLWLAVKAL